jgi:hypothetical protein
LKPITQFHDTTHARARSRERDLPLELMKTIVNHHDSKMQQYRGDHGGFVFKFKRKIDGRMLAVIAEVKHNECWLISGFEICTET